MSGPVAAEISQQVALALAEDIGSGDLTAELVPASATAQARIVCRQAAVLCGCAWVDAVFAQIDEQVSLEWRYSDGDQVSDGDVLCLLSGPARSLLTGERTALNFLQSLSGTATRAAQYVAAVADTQARILDTRKTVPGLRLAQKYAATCGGASNHRIGLYDAILIKENHIAAAGSIAAAMAAATEVGKGVEIEVEVEDLEQLTEALDAGAKRVLLDNFDLHLLRDAVALNQGRARLEASGGVNLDTVAGIAQTGVDDISVGDITKDIQAVDLSMRFL